MQPIKLSNNQRIPPQVARAKLVAGIVYGAVAGAAFAGVTWGWDAYLLHQAHALFPWLKLAAGLVICGLIGGVAGGLSAWLRRSSFAVLIWLGAALPYAWLVVALPFQIVPRAMALLEPELNGLLDYVYYSNFSMSIGVAFFWIGIFAVIVGLLQLPLNDSAVFSTSLISKAAPSILCTALMGINGMIVDGLNNEALRTAVISVNETIQFSIDHQGQEIDTLTKLHMHLVSLKMVEEYINLPRHLVVRSYDQYLGQIDVLVRFGDVWVNCLSFYNQPTNCKVVDQQDG